MQMTWTRSLSALGILTSSVLLAQAALAQAEGDTDHRWHVGISTGMVFEDTERQIEDGQNYIYGLSFGRMFTPNIGIDFQYDRYSMDFDIPTPTGLSKTRQITYGVIGRYFFRPGQDTRPFVMLGTGIQEHKNAFDNGRDIYASVGAGVEHTYSDRFSVRFQGEMRYDNDRATFNRSTGFNDFLLTAGLNFKLGAKPKPQPVARPEPVVQAPVTPPRPEPLFSFNAMVLFEFDSSILRPEAQEELNEAAQDLNTHNELVLIEVGGHTCDIGSTAYNENLSRERAEAVVDYLVSQGVAANRLQVKAYGESDPRVPNTSIENRQQNRRVELSVLERSDR